MSEGVSGLLSIGLLLSLCSCVENTSKFQSDISRLEKTTSDLRSYQAEQTTQIESVRAELRQLTGRIDELEYSQSKKVGSDISDLKRDLSIVKSRVPPPPIVPAAELSDDEDMVRTLPDDISGRFLNGLTKLRDGSFNEAQSFFQEALDVSDSNHQGQWSPSLIFWLGVSADGLGDNKGALQRYHAVVSRFPKHPRAPLALLREGSVFIRLRDSTTAKLTFKKLMAEYPKSPLAAVAKERLKDL